MRENGLKLQKPKVFHSKKADSKHIFKKFLSLLLAVTKELPVIMLCAKNIFVFIW